MAMPSLFLHLRGCFVASIELPNASLRGITRDTDQFPGTTVLSVRTCRGVLAKKVIILTDLMTDRDVEELQEFLERSCPSDPVMHGAVCPSTRRQLSLVLERNEAALARRERPRLHPG